MGRASAGIGPAAAPHLERAAYGEEEITLLEEEVLPAIRQCLARVDALDQRLLAEQELLQRSTLESQRHALI